jgi:hypothetical protein|tara:strand:+ start:120 stop:539 length:420 start_codon:yes stop_codon:yes gene_type:complete
LFYSQNRKEQRKFLANAWQKFLSNKSLEPIEVELTSIIKIHPEYQKLINDIELDYFPESGEVNPFLHINLHLSLREQLSINQPKGIRNYYDKIINKVKDPHEAEHIMMECIAEMIFLSQKNNTVMDHKAYISCLDKHAK